MPDVIKSRRSIISEGTAPVYRIVLTGGPCGGKTTALERISNYLRERGFEVMTCPEAFSIIASNGMSMDYYAAVPTIGPVIQGVVMDLQARMEDGFTSILRARGKPAVVLCDRGLMDGSAYCSTEEWDELLETKGIASVCDIREGRYNAVFHLVSAAEGAEQYYTLENNVVRTETAEEARILDRKTRAAWVGHPKLCVFDNSTDFEEKMGRVVDVTANLVGLPSTLRRVTTKFALRGCEDIQSFLANFPEGVKHHVFEVEKVWLYTENTDTQIIPTSDKSANPSFAQEYSFIRKRSQGKGAVYGQTIVQRHFNLEDSSNPQEIESKRIITSREYASAYKSRDTSRHIVRQTRVSFIWKTQSFNVHVYKEPIEAKGLGILHCQVEEGAEVDLPQFLDVERQLRNDKADKEKYGSFQISLIR
mmetsp:Transcript_2205/g.3269  ORF Transcript_2205/g.3269 Transcript_2205/m.3269 type:complete len:420 (+) Transcript_2205:34-1293(+)|eukprot:CAMPEP_0195539500 /NCGR_PEP_ID=MMETSP0794_2-20130614/50085_1 /TAXON_ID=515487 /ORGANISM="Stephanopyxis turris, Strain CCMP 815" /LENGTH=419 /DNA_ID=CAMNT_0040673533 /DNA_START=14 /DNA_END=1273 /DNA_ORIENTATION=-